VRRALVWQLNEPWPAISWALIDFCREPKPAYDLVRRVFSPVLVSVEYALQRYAQATGSAPRCGSSATGMSRSRLPPGVALLDAAGQAANRLIETLNVAADSAEIVGHLDWRLPEGSSWRLVCELKQHREPVARTNTTWR